MKKVGIILLGIILFAAGCDNKILIKLSQNVTTALTLENSFGSADLEVEINFEEKYQCIIIRRTGDTYVAYTNGNNQIALPADQAEAIFSDIKTNGENVDALMGRANFPKEKFLGNFYTHSPEIGTDFINTYFADDESTGFSFTIPVQYNGLHAADFMLLMKKGSSIDAFAFTGEINAEFFDGESALFESVDPDNEYSYKDKALTFLSLFWEDDQFDEYRQSISSIHELARYDALRQRFAGNQEIIVYRSNFQRALSKHFNFLVEEQENLEDPKRFFTEFNHNSFTSLYSKDRNIYIAAYMLYIQKKNKPLLSNLVRNELTIRGGVEYDYRDYQGFSREEGQEFAEKALRYFTWGVDYTPYRGVNTELPNQNIKEIYKEDAFRNLINHWVNGESTSRENNYLPEGVQPTDFSANVLLEYEETVPTTHIITGDFKENYFNLYGLKEAGSTLAVRHVDIWTAENIAWKKDTVKSVHTSGVPANTDLSKLYNRTIFGPTNEAENNDIVAVSSTITRDDNNVLIDNSLELGYTFEHELYAGGIILAYKKRQIANHEDFKEKDLSVFLKNDGEWSQEPIRIQEYNFDMTSPANGGTFWKVKGSEKGYTLAEDHFKQTNEEIVYCYITFQGENNRPYECEGVKIRFKYNQEETFSVNFLEMMVFDGNPVSYFAGFKNGVVRFNSFFENHPQYQEGTGSQESLLLAGDDFINIPVDFKGGGRVPVKTVVLWENSIDSVMTGDFAVFDKEINREYFKPYRYKDVLEHSALELSTPFWKIYPNSSGTTSNEYFTNPMPYSVKGIDSPRTFAYKMVSQERARKLLKQRSADMFVQDRIASTNTLLAVNANYFENYNESYILENDLAQVEGFVRNDTGTININLPDTGNYTLKPFLPGRQISSESAYTVDTDNPYHIDKLAGVDSLGIVMGSLAMLPEDMVISNYLNQNAVTELNAYYRMSAANRYPGMDEQGKPAFYSGADNENSFLNGNYRFSQADIERNTLLIPDLGEMQEGDLLVRYKSEFSEFHIGIILGFDKSLLDEERDEESIRLFMESVQVISVRKGFQMVTLGTWGNPKNGFGGFSLNPETYQVRRMVKAKSTPDDSVYAAREWENLLNPYLRETWSYPSASEVPRGYVGINGERDQDNDTNAAAAVEALLARDLRYYRYLPPTSYLNREVGPVFNLEPNQDHRITCYSGWRLLNRAEEGGFYQDYLSYHRGLDIGQTTDVTWDIIAPENGIFWVLRNGGRFEIKLPNGDIISETKYRDGTYGFVSVLWTNPEKADDPYDKGRVYLFAHQATANNNDPVVDNVTLLETRYNLYYNNGAANPAQTLPYKEVLDANQRSISWDETQRVAAKDWIGFMGNRGNSGGPHIHLEIYEWFPDVDGVEGGSWERVDPLTAFPEDIVVDAFTNSDMSIELYDAAPANRRDAFFLNWNRSTR